MSSTLAEFSTVCARCDGKMVSKPDAIGRLRLRCPRCDGVSAPQPRHPDDAMLPQGLVRASSLPLVRPGQLRCQRCARGVSLPSARFCDSCGRHASFAAKACLRCGLSFQPAGPNSRYCEGCK